MLEFVLVSFIQWHIKLPGLFNAQVIHVKASNQQSAGEEKLYIYIYIYIYI